MKFDISFIYDKNKVELFLDSFLVENLKNNLFYRRQCDNYEPDQDW